MATKATPNVVTGSTPTLAEAQATLTRLQSEAAALRAALTGEVHSPTTRREEQARVTQTGAVERVLVDVLYDDVRQVSALERRQARRRLDAVVEEMKVAEEAVEVARAAAATAARAAREALVAEGLALVRRELPDLVRRQAQLQQEWQRLQGHLEALDQRLGMARFTEAAWGLVMAPGAQFDAFVAHCRESYGLDLD